MGGLLSLIQWQPARGRAAPHRGDPRRVSADYYAASTGQPCVGVGRRFAAPAERCRPRELRVTGEVVGGYAKHVKKSGAVLRRSRQWVRRAAGCDTRKSAWSDGPGVTSARTIPDRVAIVAADAGSRPVPASSQTAPTVASTHISISCSGPQNRNSKSAGDPAGGDSTKPLSCPDARATSCIAASDQPSASRTIGAGRHAALVATG